MKGEENRRQIVTETFLNKKLSLATQLIRQRKHQNDTTSNPKDLSGDLIQNGDPGLQLSEYELAEESCKPNQKNTTLLNRGFSSSRTLASKIGKRPQTSGVESVRQNFRNSIQKDEISQLSTSLNSLTAQIRNLLHKVSAPEWTPYPTRATKNNLNQSRYQGFIEDKQAFDIRDQQFLVRLPEVDAGQSLNDYQLKSWIGKVFQQILSISFNSFAEKKLNYIQTKIFCCSNILKNIVYLNSVHRLQSKDLELMDKYISFGILPYMEKKYPVIKSGQTNEKFKEAIKEVGRSAITRNYLKASDIVWQFRESAIYSDLIMINSQHS